MNTKFMTLVLSTLVIVVSSVSFAMETVRVRVLERFHPTQISVADLEDDKIFLVSINDQLPETFQRYGKYKISIPSISEVRTYSGSIEIYRELDELVVVNTVELEDYVASVVLSEIGWAEPEAMISQSVLARTWAVKNLKPAKNYDFNDLTSSQNYWGISKKVDQTLEIIGPHQSKVLTFEGELIEAVYHSECGGVMYSALEIWGGSDYPYLGHKRLDPGVSHPKESRRWSRELSKDEIASAIGVHRIVSISAMTKNGQKGIIVGSRFFGIDDFRLRINRKLGWNQLLSNEFVVSSNGKLLIFEGKGFGHLVGMCQVGAINLAKSGLKWRAILAYFYPGTEIHLWLDGKIRDDLSEK